MAHGGEKQTRIACEFFAGMGLVHEALVGEGWTVAYANDIDPLKARLYEATTGHTLDQRDVHDLCAQDLPKADLWTASFPCTDLSLAGKGAGIHAGQSGAVWGLLRLLEETPTDDRSGHLLFENVLGLLTSHGGADFRALVQRINELGSGMDPLRIDARWFTPQSRPRLFLIATSTNGPTPPPPADPHVLEATSVRTEAIVRAMRANDDLLWHARSTPPPARTQVVLEEILEDLPEDHPAWWPKDRAKHFRAQIHPNHEKLAQSMVRSAQTRAVPAFRRVRPVGLDGAKKSVIELRDDGLAGCLRTPKGGSAKQMLFVAGKGGYKVRFMTPLECARLQGLDRVPEGFRDNEILFGLGDAVCVPAARHALRIIDQVADSTRALTTLWAG